jgi:predicted house-cleaning NTP pyrophosphatase (Maf/HAM1 superfamily)
VRALGRWLALVAAVAVGGRAALAWKDVDDAHVVMRALDTARLRSYRE